MFPKLIFKKAKGIDNINELVWFSHIENSKNAILSYYQFMIEIFPELEGKLKNNISDEEILDILKENILPILDNLYHNSLDKERYEKIWIQIGNDIFYDLENVLETKWDKDITIVVKIGLYPVLSRNIENYTFKMNYGVTRDFLIASIIHELCHFLFFKKWRELYLDTNNDDFNYPSTLWYLSEALIDVLINNDTFKKYTSSSLEAYPYFYKIKINDKYLVDIIRGYFNDYKIDIALKKSYELFLKYENVIKIS